MKPARIAVLVVALAAGAVAALLAGRSDPPAVVEAPKADTIDVLTAKIDIPIGHLVTAQDLQWQPWPPASANGVFIRRSDRADAIEQLSGSIVRSSMAAGEPIRDAKLVKGNGSGFLAAVLPSGMRGISTEVSPETGAGGFILPNDRVDVLLTRHDRAAEKRTGTDTIVTETILTNVRVLAIDQAVEEKNGQRVVIGKTATLELAPRQAETLARARQVGSISLTLRSLADANAVAKPVDSDEGDSNNKEINMVRYGVTTTTSPK